MPGCRVDKLGRPPDPIVQAPFSLQNHNRYSYVMNRPFAFTDPSGFQQEHQTGPGGGIVGGGGAGGGAGSSGGSTAGGTEGVDLNGGSVELGSYRGKDENGGMVFQGDRFISAPHRGAEASGDRSATAPEPSNQSGAKAQTETAVPAASGAGRGPGEGSGGFKRSVREFIRNVVEASNTGARMPSGLGWALATPAAAQTQPTLTQLSSGQAAEALVTAGPIGDVETLADDNASGAQKCVAAVGMILPFLKGGTRALKAADLGLSGKGIAVLTGSIMDAGTTRIIMVDKIYADAAGIPPREAALAFSSILDNARAAGISTLQIQAAFANERLSTVVQALATRAGGTFSTVGGVDTITFSLGGHH